MYNFCIKSMHFALFFFFSPILKTCPPVAPEHRWGVRGLSYGHHIRSNASFTTAATVWQGDDWGLKRDTRPLVQSTNEDKGPESL